VRSRTKRTACEDRALCVIVFVFLAVLLFALVGKPEDPWVLETVREAQDIGRYCSISLDPSGNAHVSYLDSTGGSLKYAYQSATGWHIETIAEVPRCYTRSSICVDASGTPHVCWEDYHSGPGNLLFHAVRDGSGWHIETAATCAGGAIVSLTTDHDGWPHVSFSDNGGLNYAYKDEAGWHVETVDAAAQGVNSSLSLSTDGIPTIAYCTDSCSSETTHDLWVASKQSESWVVETVDTESKVCGHVSLAVDSEGRLHVSYYNAEYGDSTSEKLRYAHKDASGWHTETVPGSAQMHLYTSIALDSEDWPHLLHGYYLGYAFKDAYGWHYEEIDVDFEGGYYGLYASLVLDNADHAHIAFHQWMPYSRLFYGQNASGDWEFEAVDAGGAFGEFASMDVDSDGHAHISYYARGTGDLQYAYHTPAGWQWEAVDTAGDVGWCTSIALDDAGNPYISYIDRTECKLKYAHENGGEWEVAEIDDVGTIPSWWCYVSTSIALDPDGWPHISYYDWASEELRHAYCDAGGWHAETVDDFDHAGAGVCSSMAVDSEGDLYIAYRAGTYLTGGEVLRYAHGNVSDWAIETVYATIRVLSRQIALALDSAQFPHISYGTHSDETQCDALYYAYEDAAGWHVEVVDDASCLVGSYSSVTLDRYDRVHLAYHDHQRADVGYALVYAYDDGAGWSYVVVDERCTPGEYITIRIGPHGERHIGYLHPSYGDLMYAYAGPVAPPVTSATFRVDEDGNLLSDRDVHAAAFGSGAADVAEWVLVTGPAETGSVLEFDPDRAQGYRESQTRCSQLVAGVVSSEPGIALGANDHGPQRILLALTGIVPVKVTNEGGPIRPGDLLVSSSTPGHAMRWAGPGPCPCSLVGKALEPMTETEGLVLVLLTAH